MDTFLKLFLTLMTSAIAALLRKSQQTAAVPYIFTATLNGAEKIQSHDLVAHRFKDHLHLQVSLDGRKMLTMHISGVTGAGIYEFLGYTSACPNVLTLEDKTWLSQVYTSYSPAGGGYIKITSLTPYTLEATFSITASLDAPDFSRPVATMEFTRGYVSAPLMMCTDK
jgi:hypothetical protein